VNNAKILVGDNRETLKSLPDGSVQTCITSPPYWGLRDYGNDEQIGLESSPEAFVEELCKVFDEVWRVLADDGTLWLNLGDSYAAFRDNKATPDSLRNGEGTKVAGASNRNPSILKQAGLKHKDLVGIPWRVAFALQSRGWYLRQDIIWAKPNPMPESVTDRCTKSHEYIFLLTKSPRYYYDNEAIKESVADSTISRLNQNIDAQLGSDRAHAGDKSNGSMKAVGNGSTRNKRDVWTVSTKAYSEAHFAVYPPDLILPCVLAGSRQGDTVLDPFSGSGTTGAVALENGRNYIGCELNPEYALISEHRISNASGMFGEVEVIA
jgi:DNA modification methylase